MRKQTRRKFTAAFKAKVALEAFNNQQTLAELSKKFELKPVRIPEWKAEFIENMGASLKKRMLWKRRQSTPRSYIQFHGKINR